MSWTKGKSSGWASFDLKHRQKQDVEPGVDSEPYPPMPNPLISLGPCQTFGRSNDLSSRSFSSVLLPSAEVPTLTENRDYKKPPQVGSTSRKLGDNVIEEHCGKLDFEKLKELYNWAGNSLIEDIMVAVNNDIDKASTFMKAMGSTGRFDHNKETVNVELGSTSKDPLHVGITLKADRDELVKVIHLAEGSSASEEYLSGQNKDIRVDYSSYKNNYCEDATDMEWILSHLNSIPIEPEHSEDDVYLSHRKDALKTMRSASQHSRAATNAFLRGDHFSAQQHSVKAREEWMAAERLNAKAAKEILSIRNSNNDSWKLDLHGLHAAEAIQALKEHLLKIETQIPPKPLGLPNGDKKGDGIVLSQPLESSSVNVMDMDKLYGHQTSSKPKPVSLQVITGRGNHSRGQAALPIAVRSFLNENGYRFNDTKPGMITVVPKFRYR